MKCAPLAFIVLLATLGFGQSALDVDVCNLIEHPSDFNMKWVRVRAKLPLAFESFALSDGRCSSPMKAGVWVEFGGDQSTPATYCCGSGDRKPKSTFKINGVEVPLVRNQEFELLMNRLTAKRERKPDGEPCYGEWPCYFYSVTATFTGLFVAIEKSPDLASGYGHLGCCHLLVVSRVSDVSAERQPVPAGGSYSCKVSTWKDAETSSVLLPSLKCRDRECRRQALNAALESRHTGNEGVPNSESQQLHESIDYEDVDGNTITSWQSEDMLTMYKATISKSGDVSLEQTACSPIVPPFPQATPIVCRDYSYDFETVHAPIAVSSSAREQNLQRISLEGFKRAQSKWKLSPPEDLKFTKCDPLQELPKFFIGGCSYNGRDTSFDTYVQVRKYKATDKAHSAVAGRWIAYDATAYVCKPE